MSRLLRKKRKAKLITLENSTPELRFEANETSGGQDTELTHYDGHKIRCGQVSGSLLCENGHRFYVRGSCDRQECPVCWGMWMKREEESITDRLGWARKQLSGKPFSHFVVSFNSFPSTKREYREMRAAALKKCKRLGVIGGVMVPHLRYPAHTLHFHIAGFGRIDFRHVEEDYLVDGLVIKMIRKIDMLDRLSAYELDHALVVKGCQTVTWFGVVSTRKITVTETSTMENAVCDLCGSDLREEREIRFFDGGTEKNPYHKVFKTLRQYAFR